MTEIKYGVGVLPTPDKGAYGQGFPEVMLSYLKGLSPRFGSLIVPDHISSLTGSSEGYYILEGMTLGTYLSALFPRFKLETMVICNSYRNPALLAKMSATLSDLTNGRFTLGIGAGWVESEYRQFGFEYPPNEVRVKQLEEAVQIIRRLWTEDHVSFKGRYYRVDDVSCYPKPTNPTLMIGGTGEKLMLRLVAKYADKWNVSMIGDPFSYGQKVEVLRRHCENVGRGFDDIVKSQLHLVALADSDAEARRVVKSGFIGSMCDIVGSPKTVVEKLRKHIELGATEFSFYFIPFPNPRSTQLFVDEVIPEL